MLKLEKKERRNALFPVKHLSVSGFLQWNAINKPKQWRVGDLIGTVSREKAKYE